MVHPFRQISLRFRLLGPMGAGFSFLLDAGRESDAAGRGCDLYLAPRRGWRQRNRSAQRQSRARRARQNGAPDRSEARGSKLRVAMPAFEMRGPFEELAGMP